MAPDYFVGLDCHFIFISRTIKQSYLNRIVIQSLFWILSFLKHLKSKEPFMRKMYINSFAWSQTLCGPASEYLVERFTLQSIYTLPLVESLGFKIVLYGTFLFTDICYSGIYSCIPP